MAERRSEYLRRRHRAAIASNKPPCALCGERIDYDLRWPHPRCFVVDHILPVKKGGADVLENKQPAHAECNRQKWMDLESPVLRRSGSLR